MDNGIPCCKKVARYGIFITLLVTLGYGAYHFLHGSGNDAMPSMPPTVVETASVKSQVWQEEIPATGTLSANQGVMIKPDVAGKVTKIFFTSGSYIEEGKPLIQIYPDILQAQLDRNKAALRLSELDFQRYAALYKKGSIAKSQYDQAAAKLAQDKAVTEQTEAELRQHTLTAPFAGQAGLRLVDLGDYVSPGQNIVSLQAIDPMRVEFSIPEVYLNLLAIGQTVDIKTAANPTTTFKGTVYAFDSVVDPNTRSLDMWAHIPNKDHQLVPGTFANLTLHAGSKKETLVIPQSAVVYNPQSNYVFTVINNTAKKKPITIGLRKKDQVEIIHGLQPGEVVVTAGQLKLFDGSPVLFASELKKSPPQDPSSSAPPSHKVP